MTPAVAVEARRALPTLALCFVAVLCEGLDIQSMGLAALRMGPALHLARDQLGPLFSASIVGLLIGAVVFGRLADRWGRKRTLTACLVVFGVFSLASALVSRFEALLAVRLITGLGLGGALPQSDCALRGSGLAREARQTGDPADLWPAVRRRAGGRHRREPGLA